MATSSEDLNGVIAVNLRELRRNRGMTLDDMAELTGVSKSMLGQIERGECGLSVATLWKISMGLKISFTSLMKETGSRAEIVDNKALKPLTNGRSGFRLYPVFPVEADRGFEIMYIELDPGAKSASVPHEHGTEEFVLVNAGVLHLTVGEEEYDIPAGHSIRYAADQTHCYANCADRQVQLCMIIRYAGNLL